MPLPEKTSSEVRAMSDGTTSVNSVAGFEPEKEQAVAKAIETITSFISNYRGDLQTPSVVSTPEVCGGAPRIIRTRIPVWTLERMRQLGVTEADILLSYPALKAVDLVQAWVYADRHRDEIERQIRENEEN
jgi:uncharacterized protein (DUF433 family)